jgi:hypothetical protein
MFSAGFQLSQTLRTSVLQTPSPGEIAASAAGQEVSQVGSEITRRNLNVQPTIKAPIGYKFNIEKTSGWSAALHQRWRLIGSVVLNRTLSTRRRAVRGSPFRKRSSACSCAKQNRMALVERPSISCCAVTIMMVAVENWSKSAAKKGTTLTRN